MEIAVIGGGMSGLTAAFRLASQRHDVTLFEKESWPGGLAGAVDLNGHRLDKYYRHIFKTDLPILRLIEDLGLTQRLMWRPSKIGFYSGGRIYPFGTPMDLLRFAPLPVTDRIRFGLGVYYLTKLKGWGKLEDVSAREWITRWMGRATYDVVWRPLLRLKFGKASEDVSAAWVWGRIHPRAQSRSKGMKTEELGYMTGSFAVLMEVLAEKIGALGATLRFSQEVLGVHPVGDRWSVETQDGMGSFDAVLLAVPLPIALKIVSGWSDSERAAYQTIDYQSVHCLILELVKPLSDIYWLNVVDPGIRFGGLIEHTNFVPPSLYDGKHIVYLFQYLDATHPDFSMGPEETLQAYWPSLTSLFPEVRASDVLGFQLCKDVYATPIYAKGFSRRKPLIETSMKGLFMANTAQIYPEDRNMSNGVALAEEAVALVASRCEKGGAP